MNSLVFLFDLSYFLLVYKVVDWCMLVGYNNNIRVKSG